jgi:ankyrin repeat protein
MPQTLEDILSEKLLAAVDTHDEAEVKNLIRIAYKAGLEPMSLVNRRGPDGDTALHKAARHPGDAGVITHILLREGANILDLNPKGESALHIAAFAGNLKISTQLIECGSNIRIEDMSGKTPLDIAKEKNFAEEAALLVRYGGERQTPAPAAVAQHAQKLTR